MRKAILTVLLGGLLCLPVLGQFDMRRFLSGEPDANMMLTSKDVQKDLKLSDDQLKSLTKARETMTKAVQAARADMDREAMTKATADYTKALTKFKDELTSDQKRRLAQLEVQASAKGNHPAIFGKESVQKGLSLTAKQKETIKAALSELDKDTKELADDVKGDFSRFGEVRTKIQGLNKDTFTKITKALTDDQKKSWKEMQGEEFKGEFVPAFGKGKGKKKDGV
jgi:hypothetical protein